MAKGQRDVLWIGVGHATALARQRENTDSNEKRRGRENDIDVARNDALICGWFISAHIHTECIGSDQTGE